MYSPHKVHSQASLDNVKDNRLLKDRKAFWMRTADDQINLRIRLSREFFRRAASRQTFAFLTSGMVNVYSLNPLMNHA